MTTTTSRRAILAGAAALPVLAAPVLAITEADLIFAAIEAHKTAELDYSKWALVCDVMPGMKAPPGANDALDAAGDASHNAAVDLLDVKPTTLAGLAALSRYVADAGDGLAQYYIWFDDGSQLPFYQLFAETIADWAETFAGKAVQS
jgi:hypothetical protein